MHILKLRSQFSSGARIIQGCYHLNRDLAVYYFNGCIAAYITATCCILDASKGLKYNRDKYFNNLVDQISGSSCQ